MSVASVASSMVSIIHPDSNNSESKGAKDAGPVRRTSAVQALLTKFHPLGADKPAGPHIRHIHQNTVDRLPEDDIRRLSATFRKDVEAMTPPLSFVEDAVKTENIIKQKANDRRVKKLPWYLIHPMGPFRRRWDIVSLCLLLCKLFMDLVASFPYNIVTLYVANVDDGLRLFKLLLLTRFLRILTRCATIAREILFTLSSLDSSTRCCEGGKHIRSCAVVTGQTTPERLWSIFAMVNGAWIFGYGITNVVSMVRDLPLELRAEIREFYFNTRITVDSKLKNESKILSEMSALLRSKVALAINDSVLNKMPFFEGADHNFLMELALSMKMVCMPPHEEIGEEMFFIFRGAVEVLKVGIQVAVLGEKQYFGEMAILNENCLRTATVMTLCFCELRMLTREKFLLALTHYPSMRQKIAKIIHRRNQAVARVAKAANGRRLSTSTDKVLKKKHVHRDPKLDPISSEKSYAESRHDSSRNADDDVSQSGAGDGGAATTEDQPAATTASIETPQPPYGEDDGSGRLTADLAGTSACVRITILIEGIYAADTSGQVTGTTMGRISFCQQSAEPGDAARLQILELYQSQEELVSHVLHVQNKWMQLESQMRQMQQELQFYRATYGTTTRDAAMGEQQERAPPETTAIVRAVAAGEVVATASAAYNMDCQEEEQY
ncbi:hypothetical protein DYB32_003536 [Aphanomyces invadans]|uniref:Cyclic nucleotide-binding domain-containing protein n=1 Tax=Aphanomyces invadans TaxID=157072 RepID=A0A418B6C3_9STRA|nr:hypothetical protein DYB32_003536 [Aphanomyces invadans]